MNLLKYPKRISKESNIGFVIIWIIPPIYDFFIHGYWDWRVWVGYLLFMLIVYAIMVWIVKKTIWDKNKWTKEDTKKAIENIEFVSPDFKPFEKEKLIIDEKIIQVITDIENISNGHKMEAATMSDKLDWQLRIKNMHEDKAAAYDFVVRKLKRTFNLINNGKETNK